VQENLPCCNDGLSADSAALVDALERTARRLLKEFLLPVAVQYSPTRIVVTADDAVRIDADKERRHLSVQNTSADTDVHVIFSGPNGDADLIIPPRAMWEPYRVPRGKIWLRAASGTFDVLMIEGQ